MSKQHPSYFHKVIYILCFLTILALFGIVLWDVFLSGLRIMAFGFKLVIIPLGFIAITYILWHARKYF